MLGSKWTIIDGSILGRKTSPLFDAKKYLREVGRSCKKLVPNLLDSEKFESALLLMAGEVSKTFLWLSNSRKSNSIIFLEI